MPPLFLRYVWYIPFLSAVWLTKRDTQEIYTRGFYIFGVRVGVWS